jgi:hypothetical protein
MKCVQEDAPALTDEEKDWIKDNLSGQETRYTEIVAEMERIAPDRDAWIGGFLERIQTRGFNYNCDLLREIPDEEMPKKPARPFKVNF